MPPIIAASIGAGGALGAGLLGRSGSMNVGRMQQQTAQQALDRSRPAFDQAFRYYSGLLSQDPAIFGTAINPSVNAINQQFAAARNNILQSSYGRGGGLTAGLTNLEGNRANTLANLISAARAGGATGLADLASGQQTAGINALAGAASNPDQQGLLQQQAMGGIGSFIMRALSNPALLSALFNRGGQSLPMIPMRSLPGVPALVRPETFMPSTDPLPPVQSFFPGGLRD